MKRSDHGESKMSARTPPSQNGHILIGLDAIGAAFNRSRWTIRRWIEVEAFPPSQLPDGSWTSSLSLIDDWLMSRIEWEDED